MSTPSRLAPVAVAAVLAALVLTIALAFVPTVFAAPVPGPAGEAFYAPPSPLPAGTHGDLIRYRPAAVSLPATVPAKAWNVLYRSTDARGNPIAVSGTVLVPSLPWLGSGKRPVVDYAVGTQGLGQQCAPSREMAAGTFDEGALAGQALNRGWAVDLTDYEGYTTAGHPTYVAGISEGHAVLDIARAASQLPGAGVSYDAPFAVWGYSQGGGAGVWAGQLKSGYAPGLNLKGVAVGGVPADLTAVARNLNANVGAGFLATAAIGLDAAYPQLRLDSYLNDAGRALVADVKSICMTEAIAKYAFRDIKDYTNDGRTLDQLLAIPAWKSVLDVNKAGAASIPAPVLQYHGAADEFIPIAQARALAATYCARGMTVKFTGTYPGDHVLTAVEAALDATTWIGDRFAGRTAPSTC
jgi:hypothetical protein